MKRRVILLLMASCLLCSCGSTEKPKVATPSAATTSTPSATPEATSSSTEETEEEVIPVVSNDIDVKMPDVSNVGTDLVYVTRKTNPYEGTYTLDTDSQIRFYILNVTDDALWFSYEKGNNKLDLGKASKTASGTYEFFFETDPENSDHYVTNESAKSKGIVRTNGNELYLEADGSLEEWEELGAKGKLIPLEKPDSVKICDLSKCLGNYFEVRESIYKKSRPYVNLGKELGTDQVSYLDVRPENSERTYLLNDERKYYQFGNINFFSTAEQCDEVFGTPTQKSDTERCYSYQDKYEVRFTFQNGYMNSMGVYLESKDKAMQKYIVDNFTMQGCKIIKYDNGYEKTGKIKLPKDTVGICHKAFTIVDRETDDGGQIDREKEDIKAVQLCIPKKVYLEPYSMTELGPIKITFEEGRKRIEDYAFYDAGIWEFHTQIILPSSVRTLEKKAFMQTSNAKHCEIKLNEGLKEVKEAALSGTDCALPSSIEILGKEALRDCNPKNYDYTLPKSLKEIGDYCIYSDEVKSKPIKLSASVKKIGLNVLTYGDSPGGGFQVDPKNPYFKSNNKGWLFSKDGKKLYHAFAWHGNLNVPDGVEYIMCECMLNPNGEGGKQKVKLPKTFKKNLYSEYLEMTGE